MTAVLPEAAPASIDRAHRGQPEPSSGQYDLGSDDVARFVYRQGLGKNLLCPPQSVDDGAITSSCVPPLRARGGRGVPLPAGADPALAAPFPATAGRVDEPDVLGRLLLAAVGLQRREPSHPYADHRAVASGRAKYPVHVFVLDGRAVRYLDVYRHALVDIATAVPDELRPGMGELTVLLAGRYQDLPSTYELARASIVEAELGIAARAITVAAELHGVRAGIHWSGVTVRQAAELVAATGPGTWSAPVVMTLKGVPGAASAALPGGARACIPAALDQHLATPDPVASTLRSISHTRLAGHQSGSGAPVSGIPNTASGAWTATVRRSWEQVLAERSAGRVAGRRHGYALRPDRVSEGCLRDLLDWAGPVPAADPLRTTAEQVTVRVALQGVTGYDNGLYRLDRGALQAEFTDPATMRLLAARGGQTSSPGNEIGLRHASLAWIFTADVASVLAELGPAGWSLVQLYCGWVMHGIGLAAAAHGLISRPSRSYDEPTLQQTLRLPRRDVPMFMTICGRSAFDEPILDLRP